MNFKKIKIGNSFFILLLLYFLGYTHFLGGPYGLAKFFFVLMIVGILLFFLFIFGMANFLNRIFKKQMNYSNTLTEEKNETIKVDAKIVE